MSLSHTLVTRNTPGNNGSAAKHNIANAHSAIEASADGGQYRAALSGVLAPQQSSNLARYKAAVGGDGKLPALNVRGGPVSQQPKTGRGEFANSAGGLAGLNIVLSSGQGSI